jgi:uncharacterized phage protein (TIGR02220 family)
MKLIPKNWKEFQHYKDRNPTWIKLHRGLLDDFVFQSLPVASRALAPMLWLLASEHKDGVIDAEPEVLAFRLRCTLKEIETALSPLIGKGFFEVVQFASKPLAEGYQESSPERERERETETESMSGKPDVVIPNFKNEAREVLDFLNGKVGRNYQPVPANLDLITARLKEGASAAQCRQVIAKKSREWLYDEKMAEYLRPATLFNKTKFAQYVGELT